MSDFNHQFLSSSKHCQELAHPNIPNFIISCLLLVGILVSYLPQHFKIIRKRSSEGLSPYFVLLGATSGTCAIANILVLPTSRADIACCKVNDAFSCAAGLLGVAQIGVQWGCFFLITFLFLLFIPRQNEYPLSAHHIDINTKTDDYGWRQALGVFILSVVFFVVVLIVSVVMLGAFPQHLQGWAVILGTVGGLLACVQYIPQIAMTWHRGTVGSLSIPMMCIQTPGSFVFVASLAVRLGTDGWSTWFVYLVTGILQGSLLVMAICFYYRDRDSVVEDGSSDEYVDENNRRALNTSRGEQEPLLAPTPSSGYRSSLSHRGSSRNGSFMQNGRGTNGSLRNGSLNGHSGRNTGFAGIANILANQFKLDTALTRAGTQYFDAQSRKNSKADSTVTVVGPTTIGEPFIPGKSKFLTKSKTGDGSSSSDSKSVIKSRASEQSSSSDGIPSMTGKTGEETSLSGSTIKPTDAARRSLSGGPSTAAGSNKGKKDNSFTI